MNNTCVGCSIPFHLINCTLQFTPASLANATLVDPRIHVTSTRDLMFTLSAKGGVAPWTWLDHPAGTVGVFVHAESGLPSNGFYLVPGIDRTGMFPAMAFGTKTHILTSEIHLERGTIQEHTPRSCAVRRSIALE
jgi:hypothetical protein